MSAQPRASRRLRPHVRVLGWFAAAVLAALALLPGTIVQVASGSAASQIPISEGSLTDGASPAPAATPEASPTPIPEATPTPTRTPTPSPTPPTPTPSPTPLPSPREPPSPLAGTWAGSITGYGDVPIRVTVSLQEGTNGNSDWGQIDLRDEAGIGCTHGFSLLDPERWDEWQEEFGLPEPEAGELVYEVEITCYDCYDRWIDLPLLFVRLNDQGDLEVTPFFRERYPGFTLAPGDPRPAEPESDLVVDPMTVARGQELMVTVSSFVAYGITISWFEADGDWQELHLGDIDTGADGSGTFLVTVPLAVPDGPATILAEGRPAFNYCEGWVTEDITVAGGPSPPPTLEPTPAPAASPLPTLPPTDTATGSAVVGSDAWQFVLVGFAAIVVGVLAIGSRQSTQSDVESESGSPASGQGK